MKEKKKINEEKSTPKKVYETPKVVSYSMEVEGVCAASPPLDNGVDHEDKGYGSETLGLSRSLGRNSSIFSDGE